MIGINPFSGRCHHKLGVLVWENVCELTPVTIDKYLTKALLHIDNDDCQIGVVVDMLQTNLDKEKVEYVDKKLQRMHGR